MSNMYQQMILDHYKNPHNKVSEQQEGYLKKEALNPSCGDVVTVFLKIEDDVVTNIKFMGEGCSICCASSSVMTVELLNKNIKEVDLRIENFKKVLKNGETFSDFEDANIFEGIKNFPARYKCAVLGWDALSNLLKEYNE